MLEKDLCDLFFDQDQTFFEQATELLLSSPSREKFSQLVDQPADFNRLRNYFFGSYQMTIRRELDVLESCPPTGGGFL